jgi:hypothetical protein
MTFFYENTDISITENFLSENEAAYLINVAESTDPSIWRTEGENSPESDSYIFWDDKNLFLHKLPEFDRQLILDIEERAHAIYEKVYGLEGLGPRYVSINIIHRFSPGHSMEPHQDRGPHYTNNDIMHGFVIYINDNYSGGEIYYPKKDIAIKPNARSLVIHPGSEEYTHGVKPVESGLRYTLTSFSRDPILGA